MWQSVVGQGAVTPSPTLNILFGLSYAHELEAHSYGPGPIPLVLLSILSLPPNFVTTDVEARRLMREMETTRLAAFGTTRMVSCHGQ